VKGLLNMKGGSLMERNVNTANKETIDEVIGILTAISIVSKRMANRLTKIDKVKMSSDKEKE